MLSIHALFTPVRTILKKQTFHKSKFNFDLLSKEDQILGFHAVLIVKTFPFMYQIDVDPRRDDDASPMSH